MHHLLPLLLSLAAVALAAADLPPDAWAGTWSNDQFTLHLTGQPPTLAGQVVVGGKTIAIAASERAGSLNGTSTENGPQYAFKADLVGEQMLLIADDGTRYELRRHVVPANPLSDGGALPVDPLVGVWRTDAGEIADLRADGSAVIAGAPARWKAVGTALVFANAQGEVTLPYRLAGEVLSIEVSGQPVAYRRHVGEQPAAAPVAPPAPAAPSADATAPDSAVTATDVVGVWLGPEGSCALSTGGVGTAKGKTFAWTVQGSLLILTQDGQRVEVPARMAAGRLVLDGVAMERAIGAAGWWSGWDGHPDGAVGTSIIHHLALHPDGSVGHAKGVMDATQRQAWFAARSGTTAAASAGRWQQEGNDVQVTLATSVYRAVFDPAAQSLRLIGMGQINEGQDVAFIRE